MGGNSAKASSGINAVGTAAQKAQLIEDSIEMFVQDTIKSGQVASSIGKHVFSQC
jgi:fumarate reductase flavoprotein subunit